MKRYIIVGGAGFIGSHCAEEILKTKENVAVVIYDNFSSGRMRHLEAIRSDRRLTIVTADAKDLKALSSAMKGSDVIYHFASNPDISRAAREPDIDFQEGTYLTNNVLEAARLNGVKKIIYASGSGVYGDAGHRITDEDYPYKNPVSTYGASKLAGEALISAYCHLFGMRGASLRFANVVGPRQTHGVGYDFVKKLLRNKKRLEILGDGRQSKSYIYIADVVSALMLLDRKMPKGFSCYNVATRDYITVREIAGIVAGVMGLTGVRYSYTGGSRGWKGDVPVVRLDTRKIRKMGWNNRYTCRQAVKKSIAAIYEDAKRNRSGTR